MNCGAVTGWCGAAGFIAESNDNDLEITIINCGNTGDVFYSFVETYEGYLRWCQDAKKLLVERTD